MKIVFWLIHICFLPLMAQEMTLFDILPGRLHQGGSLKATPGTVQDAQVMIQMDYEIRKKELVPVPSKYLKGHYEQKLPVQFLDERGYLDLERVKSMPIAEAIVYHKGRVKSFTEQDAHLIHIVPHNKKSEMFLTYHPNFSGLGWGEVRLILHTELPLLGDYELKGKNQRP